GGGAVSTRGWRPEAHRGRGLAGRNRRRIAPGGHRQVHPRPAEQAFYDRAGFGQATTSARRTASRAEGQAGERAPPTGTIVAQEPVTGCWNGARDPCGDRG